MHLCNCKETTVYEPILLHILLSVSLSFFLIANWTYNIHVHVVHISKWVSHHLKSKDKKERRYTQTENLESKKKNMWLRFEKTKSLFSFSYGSFKIMFLLYSLLRYGFCTTIIDDEDETYIWTRWNGCTFNATAVECLYSLKKYINIFVIMNILMNQKNISKNESNWSHSVQEI